MEIVPKKIKMESIRKLSYLIFSEQKPCTRIIQTILPSFFYIFQGLKMQFVICNNTKENFSWDPKH